MCKAISNLKNPTHLGEGSDILWKIPLFLLETIPYQGWDSNKADSHSFGLFLSFILTYTQNKEGV